MAWKIRVDSKAAKALAKLDKTVQKKILHFLEEEILTSQNPRSLGKPLTGKLKGIWRYRVGDYRILANIHDKTLTILVVHAGHRKDIYKFEG